MKYALLLLAALALPASAARLAFDFGAELPSGDHFRATARCEFPTGQVGFCAGSYTYAERIAGCAGTVHSSGYFEFSGDLRTPGTRTGGVLLSRNDIDIDRTRGTCTVTPTQQVSASSVLFTWDGTTGTFTIDDTEGSAPYRINGRFKLDGEPAFAMGTFADFSGGQTLRLAAEFIPRAEDMGQMRGIYAFALLPASRQTALKEGTAKTTAEPCVVAQVTGGGQLVPTPFANLQPVINRALAGINEVTLFQSADFPSVAGATFFVGYGTSATDMLAKGTSRRAFTMPGSTVECRVEGPQTGWWWSSTEGGRGYSIERQGNNLFMAAYFYAADGRATWLVASGPMQLDGLIFNAPLYACSGGMTLPGNFRAANCAQQGDVSISFNSPTSGRMTWPGGTVDIERFDVVAHGLAKPRRTTQPEDGWWWNAAENGRGFFIEWQGTTAEVAGYMYDDAGNPIWYIGVVETPVATAMNGAWWQFANGMTQAGPYKPATLTNNNVGPVSIQFHSATTATMTLPGGRQLALTRFRF